MKKKFLMVLLTVMAVFAVFTINASAATDGGNCGPSDSPASVTWTMDTDSGTLTISGSGAMRDYAFAQPWSEYSASIRSIVVSSGVTRIGGNAFYGCKALTYVSLPDGLTTIGDGAFYNCTALPSVTIPDTVASGHMFYEIFYNCSSLQSVAISGSSTYYGTDDGVLYSKGESGLYKLIFMPAGKTGAYTIPEGVQGIGLNALRDTHLTELTLPASLTTISSTTYTIWGSKYLQAFRVAEGNRNFSSVDGVLFNLNRTVLLAYPSGNSNPSYEIPDGVTEIGDRAFSYCDTLTSVTFPAGVTSIGDSAFDHCTGLTAVTLPDGVTSIGGYAFYNCNQMPAVTLPDSVTKIGSYAFDQCFNLKTVYYSGSEEDWGKITILSGNDRLITRATIYYNYGALILSAAWDAEHYNPGDTAIATVRLSGGAGAAYAGYQFTIDSIEGMTLKSIAPIAHEGVSGYADANPETGKVVFSLNGASDLSLDETGYNIATLTYTVNKGANGTKELTFSDEQAYLADSTPVERFITTSAPLTLHDIQVTLNGGTHVTIQPPTPYYAKYGVPGLYTNWERTKAVTVENFQCNVAAGYELASPMWSEDGTETPVPDFAALLAQTYTENKSYTVRVGVVYALTIDTGIVSVVSGAELKEDGKYYIVKNTDLVLAPVAESDSILLGVSASIGDQPVTVTRGEDGNYTIDGSALTGNITLTCDAITGTIEFVTMANYVKDTNTDSQLLRVTVENPLTGDHLTLGGQDLFWSEKYKAYVGFVAGTMNETGVRASIARAAGDGTSIGYTGDVTGDSTVNVLDALAINARLFQINWKPGYTDKGLLEMDVTGDVAVNVADIQRILAIAVGKVTA